MTAQNLYNKFLKEEITESKFLYEIRKQSFLPITKFNSFKDTIQILKTRGLINEEKNPTVPEVKCLTIDQVSPYEYNRGINFELDLFDKSVGQNMPTDEELAKTQEKVLKNLTTDQYYYTKKMMSDIEKKQEKQNLRPEELGKELKAKNQMVKGKMLKEIKIDQPQDIKPKDLLNIIQKINGYFENKSSGNNYDYSDEEKFMEIGDNLNISLDNINIKDLENNSIRKTLFSRLKLFIKDLDIDINGLDENLDQDNECESCNRDKPELDVDVMDPNELEILSKIIEEWGLTEYDLEDSDVIDELATEFQRRNGELEEGIALKDKAGNITYVKDDNEANQQINNARQKNIQLTKQRV